ncbi:MAG: hypothetical protein C4523_03735 [Myxococcales bacterium]|nr:MAG: hypothetical protein C4523_03735 [Myxococcales bacterium]
MSLRLLVVFTAVFFVAAMSAGALAAPPASGLWLPAERQRPNAAKEVEMRWRNKTYAPPDAARRQRIAQTFRKLLENAAALDAAKVKALDAELAGAGYQLGEYRGPEGHWLILEMTADQAGGGYYLIRTGKLAREVVLQAPHAIFDLHTDVLTKHIFAAQPVRAAFFADWLRYGEPGQEPFLGSPWDLSHNPETLFQDLTLAAAHTLKNAVFIQIHGFAADNVDDKDIDFIVSPGGRKVQNPIFAQAAEALLKAYGAKAVRVYPATIRQLGGTTSIQGKAVRKLGHTFIHIEISERKRTEMKRNPATAEALAKTLIGGL